MVTGVKISALYSQLYRLATVGAGLPLLATIRGEKKHNLGMDLCQNKTRPYQNLPERFSWFGGLI
jgi:hypothetical protein